MADIPLDELLREAQRLAVNLRGRPEESEALGALQRRLADARRQLQGAQAEEPGPTGKAPKRPATEAAAMAGTDDPRLELFRTSPPAEAARRLSFGALITEVGSSLAEAQRALDRQSVAYLEDARRLSLQGLGMPTAYRMPRVRAEFRFALDTTAEQGFNLLFLRDAEKVTSSNTQSVEFEIVAAPATPPPPGAAVPAALPVLDPGRREALLAALRAALSPAGSLRPEDEDSVLLFSFGPASGEAFVLGLHRFGQDAGRRCALVALVPVAGGTGWKGHLPADAGEWAHDPPVGPLLARMESSQREMLHQMRGS